MRIPKTMVKHPCKKCNTLTQWRKLIEGTCETCRAQRPIREQRSELHRQHHAYKDPTIQLPTNLPALNSDELANALHELNKERARRDALTSKHRTWAYVARAQGRAEAMHHYLDLLHELEWLRDRASSIKSQRKRELDKKHRLDPMASTAQCDYAQLMLNLLADARRTVQRAWKRGVKGDVPLGGWHAWITDSNWAALNDAYARIQPGRGDTMKSPYDWRNTSIPPRLESTV